jgi:hypothetical protein
MAENLCSSFCFGKKQVENMTNVSVFHTSYPEFIVNDLFELVEIR